MPAYTVITSSEEAQGIEYQRPEVRAQINTYRGDIGVFPNGTHRNTTSNRESLVDTCAGMLGQSFGFPPETQERSKPCNEVVIVSSVHEKQVNVQIVPDRALCSPAIIGSTDTSRSVGFIPDSIKQSVDYKTGLSTIEADEFLQKLGMKNLSASDSLSRLYRLFVEKDLTHLEFTLARDGTVDNLLIEVDDFAKHRQKELFALRDPRQEVQSEVKAAEAGLFYIEREGDIASFGYGAGLAMSTMDLLKKAGGEPANFLDGGGGANKQNVRAALETISQNPRVKAILINCFGGITRTDIVAQGVVEAVKEFNIRLPIVVRLQGTGSDEGNKTLSESGLDFIVESNAAEAARKAVQAAKKN